MSVGNTAPRREDTLIDGPSLRACVNGVGARSIFLIRDDWDKDVSSQAPARVSRELQRAVEPGQQYVCCGNPEAEAVGVSLPGLIDAEERFQ